MSANLDLLLRRWFGRLAILGVALLALNAGVYIFGVSRLSVLAAEEGQLARREGEHLADVEAKAKQTSSQVASFRAGQKVLETLALSHLKTRAERLALAQAALQDLIVADGLTSEGFAYFYSTLPGTQVRQRWRREYIAVNLKFRVSGSYPQVKKFLGDIQASEHFFILDDVSIVTSTQGATLLNTTISLNTYFVAGDGPTAPPASAAPAPVGAPAAKVADGGAKGGQP